MKTRRAGILVGVAALTALFCGGAPAATLDAALIRTTGAPAVSDGQFYGYRTVSDGPGDTAFSDALALAKSEHVPLVAIWSNEDCHYCDAFAEDLNANASAVAQWLSTNRAVCVYFKDRSGNSPPTWGHKPAACYDAYDFVYTTCGSRPVWPLVGFYYEKWDGTIVKWQHGNVPSKSFAWLRQNFGSWCVKNGIGADASVYFVCGTSSCDRLEAVPGVTTNVVVPIRRRTASKAESFVLSATFADGSTIERSVAFDAGDLEPTVEVSVPLAGGGYASGETVRLELSLSGRVLCSSAITFVDAPEDNPKNPLWFGERDATSLRPGEWTMDRDLALAKARTAGESTLTLIGGPLWCPDCVNNDAYLVDTAVFKGWTASNGVYCAAIDVPIFASGLSVPTLMSYESFDVSWLGGVTSGAGYLSRKMVPLSGNGGTNAIAILARNLNLATNTVENGGLCRGECLDPANPETGTWKTGVPCFIMQNASGEIRGRLFQFSNVSPTSAESAAAYVQRLEELRQLADDSTEEVNRHWSTATNAACEIALGRGEDLASANSTISAIDTSDFWRLTGRERWAMVTFRVAGGLGSDALPAETNARLALWKKSDEKVEKVASAEGNLATGFALADQEIFADEDIDYFIQLEALETSASFALDRAGRSVVAYALSATAKEDSGLVAFAKSSATASEADAKKAGGTLRVYAPVLRVGGASGETNVLVTVDEALTTAFADRYRLVTESVTWSDGEMGTKSVAIDVFDDANADGTQYLALQIGDSSFVLTIVDNDKANVGKLALDAVNPAAAKKGAVIAEENDYVLVGVTRTGGASGDVACTLATTAGSFAGEATLAWSSREAGEKTAILKLPLLADCKQAKAVVSFASLSGIAADGSSRTLTVQLVSTNAPRFEVSEKRLALVRYCAVSQDVAVVRLAEGAVAKIAKLSGSLPSGVTAKLAGARLLITGTPTRAGTYEAVYQVSQTLNRKTTAGLTVQLAFTVTDVAAMDPAAPGANPSVAKSRTFGDMPVVDARFRRMTGVLTGLTIPPTGRCSARYKCKSGTIALSSKGWTSYDFATGDLGAQLVVARKAYALDVCAHADGSVSIALSDPDFAEGTLSAEVAEGWSAASPATAWLGYYTAVIDSLDTETISGSLRAAGNPFLTMKMASASLAQKGTMSYAGVLPNGQAFSGSGALVRDALDTVILPVYYRTAKDFFTLAPQIAANRPAKAVGCSEAILPWWTHTETVTNGSHEVGYLRVVGSHYDTTLDLTTTVSPTALGHELTASSAIEPIPVTIEAKRVTLDKTAARAAGASLSLVKATGIVSGSFKTVSAAGKTVTATYRGVVLPDWGDGCPSCGDIPWASGAFWFSDAIPYEDRGRTKSLSVKRGDVLYIEGIEL